MQAAIADRESRTSMVPYLLRSATTGDDEAAPLPNVYRCLPPEAGGSAPILVIGARLRPLWRQLQGVVAGSAHPVCCAAAGNIGLERLRTESPQVILLDLDLAEESGLDLLQQVRRSAPHIPVLCLTSDRSAGVIIEAIKRGAYDCLVQPIDPAVLWQAVHEALDVARHMHQAPLQEPTESPPEAENDIVGVCPSMGEVYKAIGRVAGQNVPVLITGESGTGKELVARAIAAHGPRAQMPFLALNCAAMPENLLESELFGHEKGAFTGADRRRIGKFEQCNGGTIFLDEIGDMPLSLQAKILRLLQDQVFERVGGNETIRTDVRLIAATHRDLKTWSADGRFRADLYYRLGVFTIQLPPLRQRGDDLRLLVEHYVHRFNRELGRDVRQVAPETLERLRGYSWPGNIRELQSILKQALLRASGPVLLPTFLPPLLGEPAESAPAVQREESTGTEPLPQGPPIEPGVQDLYAKAHRQVDRQLLPQVLQTTQGNLRQAAEILGIARQTLRLKLRELGISVSRMVEAEPVE